MKTQRYLLLAILAALAAGTFVSQSFGGDKGFSRNLGGSLQNSGGTVQRRQFGGPIVRPVGGNQSFPVKPPSVKPTLPVGPIGPIKPPTVKPPVGPIGPIKPPVGPIKPPVGPIKPPIGPIKPPIGPIKPPIGPITPLPPICPPHPPVCPTPPICPPHDHDHCHPCWPGWGRHDFCGPVFIGLPSYCGVPAVVTETVVVEVPTQAVAVNAQALAEGAEEKLMQVPVGATFTLGDKNLGSDAGTVLLEVAPVTMMAKVNEWKADQVNLTLPTFGIPGPTKAKIWLLKADGQVANVLLVELVPAKAETAQQQAAGGSVK